MARGGRLDALGREQILHADRHPGQRFQRPGSAVGVSLLRGVERMAGRLDNKGVERLGARNIGAERLCDLNRRKIAGAVAVANLGDGKRSEEHTSELQSLMRISYAVFCLKKKTKNTHNIN